MVYVNWYCKQNIVVTFQDPNVFDQLILYEELIKDPELVVGKLFMTMVISGEHIPTAMEALRHDSQQGMKFGERGTFKDFMISDENKINIDRIYKDFHVPISCFMTQDEFCSSFPRPGIK